MKLKHLAPILALTTVTALAGELPIAPPVTPTNAPRLVYVTYMKMKDFEKSKSVVDCTEGSSDCIKGVQVIDLARWQKFQPGGRFSFLQQFYYSNTRAKSNSNRRHVSCFVGRGQEVVEQFFSSDPKNRIKYLKPAPGKRLAVSSADGKMIGIGFSVTNEVKNAAPSYHFRIASCTDGKMPMVDLADLGFKIARIDGNSIAVAATPPQLPTGSLRFPAAQPAAEEGFSIPDGAKIVSGESLPRFKLKADYATAIQDPAANKIEKLEELPWRKAKSDITTEKGARDFALIMQKYSYEGMLDQKAANNEEIFNAFRSEKRYWCNMPWLNQTPKDREGIHGMTPELSLRPSDMYPQAPKGDASGRWTDWGVAYYNTQGCEAINRVFGSESAPLATPAWNEARRPGFKDGSTVFKLLFTSADFPPAHDAFVWSGNVKPQDKSPARVVHQLRHVQMDIAVRDSALRDPGFPKSNRGARAEHNDWVFLTYYYDPTYELPADAPADVKEYFAKLPASLDGFKKMRPMGIQTGFEGPATGDSVIFAGAATNGFEGRMNGPADNFKSSCIGCHGFSGTQCQVGQKYGPNLEFEFYGFMHNDKFAVVREFQLDFSQQFALAKQYYDTRAWELDQAGPVADAQKDEHRKFNNAEFCQQ
jgi:hypothetical protein